jgi:hypothetical protein
MACSGWQVAFTLKARAEPVVAAFLKRRVSSGRAAWIAGQQRKTFLDRKR